MYVPTCCYKGKKKKKIEFYISADCTMQTVTLNVNSADGALLHFKKHTIPKV